MAKRYKEVFDPNHSQECICHRGPMNRGLEESPDGDFVDIEDYEKLQQQLAKANERADKAERAEKIATLAAQDMNLEKSIALEKVQKLEKTLGNCADGLANANERVKELEKELINHKNVNKNIHLKNTGIATLVSELTGNNVVLPKMKSRVEIKSALKKFAIEQQIEGLKDYQALCGFADCRKSIDARIAQLEEQLRKEQENG